MMALSLLSIADTTIVYYACGGGMGHVTRAAAILRQLRRYGLTQTCVITNTVYPRPLEHEAIPVLHLSGSTREELTGQLQGFFHKHSPTLFIADVFAEGVLGELATILPELFCPKVLITRHVRDDYKQARTAATAAYDLVIATEDAVAASPTRTIQCPPILIRNADELLPRVLARQRLGVGDEDPIVLVVSRGTAEWEQDLLQLMMKIWQRIHPRAHLRIATPRPYADSIHVTHYPIVELFLGVDVVIGAGGYNLFHEVEASGITGIFLPQHRRIDDQHWRTRRSIVVESPENLEQCLMTVLQNIPRTPRPMPRYTNGAETAAKAIANILIPDIEKSPANAH